MTLPQWVKDAKAREAANRLYIETTNPDQLNTALNLITRIITDRIQG